MIKSIELQNWKTHTNSHFDFTKGTNVLVGSMGSGKTSVMDAICMALFGTFPALQQRHISLQEIITARPNPRDQAQVKLAFDYNGREFTVERTIKVKGSSEAKLYAEGKFVAGPKPGDVNTAIERELEINYNLFSRAVYSEQNQLDYFLRLSPGQRKEKFDELLELDKYGVVRSNAVSVQNRLKGILEDRKKWLTELEKETKKTEVEEIKKNASAKEKQLKELVDNKDKKKTELAELKNKVKKIEEIEKAFNQLKEGISNKSFLVENLEREIKDAKKISGDASLQELEKSIRAKTDKIKEIESEIAKIEKDEKGYIEKISALRQESKGNERKITEIMEQTKHVDGAGANCPTCKTPLDEEKKKLIAKENREGIEGLEKKNKVLAENVLKLENDKAEKRKLVEKNKADMEKLKKDLPELEKEMDAHKSLGEKTKQLEKTKQELEKAKKQLEATGLDEKLVAKTKEDAIRLESSLDAEVKEEASLKELLQGIQTELDRAEKRAEEIKKLKETVSTIEQNNEKLLLFINSLRETQAQLRESLIETINEAMDSIWPSIYPYGDYSSAKMSVDEGNYELVVRDTNGKWIRVEGILSGGERSAAAICIRIAFSLVLTRNLSWIILDEPTHNLDGTAVGSLSRMMRDKMPELIEQIFVITHDKEMEKAASGSLYLLKRNKEVDEPTQVETIALES